MSTAVVVALGASTTMVTCVELSYRNQRHPFGDRRFKAALWWTVIVVIDTAAGLAILFGILTVKLVGQPEINSAKGIWLGIILGILGPLALRSPVKKVQIKDKEATVGITYVYDLARVSALAALDERLIRLRRRDVTLRRERWKSNGIDVDEVIVEFGRHIDDHERMSEDRRTEIRSSLANILTVPDDDLRLNGLIKLMKTVRFNALIDEFDSRSSAGYEPDAKPTSVSTSQPTIKTSGRVPM